MNTQSNLNWKPLKTLTSDGKASLAVSDVFNLFYEVVSYLATEYATPVYKYRASVRTANMGYPEIIASGNNFQELQKACEKDHQLRLNYYNYLKANGN